MKTKFLPFLRLLIFSFFAFPAFLITASAQSIKPDEQIIREMTAYAARVRASYLSSRPRVVNKSNQPAGTARHQNVKYTPRDESRAESSSASSLERRAFDILNEQRANNNLPPLRWSNEAAEVARLHSENMAHDRFFSHQGQDGSTVNSRAHALGVRGWSSIGENIAFNKGFRKPVEMACQQWMTSPGHRKNIMDRGWTESGIGAATAADGSVYFTQVFISR